MSTPEAIEIRDDLRIPRSELTLRATRAGGPGGQHVNTSSTRVELTWNVSSSPSLTDEQRAWLLQRLRSRLDSTGNLRVVASTSRSQYQNREEVIERFARIVAKAMERPRPRKKTRTPRSAHEARIQQKKQRGERKRMRGRPRPDE